MDQTCCDLSEVNKHWEIIQASVYPNFAHDNNLAYCPFFPFLFFLPKLPAMIQYALYLLIFILFN